MKLGAVDGLGLWVEFLDDAGKKKRYRRVQQIDKPPLVHARKTSGRPLRLTPEGEAERELPERVYLELFKYLSGPNPAGVAGALVAYEYAAEETRR